MNKIPSKFQQELYTRYLLWAYKTTREAFERIERKTTQIVIDEHIHKHLVLAGVDVKEFDQYIATKKTDEIKQKYTDESKAVLNPAYVYLRARLEAIEDVTKAVLGDSALRRFEDLFEAEFTRRILESRDPHT